MWNVEKASVSGEDEIGIAIRTKRMRITFKRIVWNATVQYDDDTVKHRLLVPSIDFYSPKQRKSRRASIPVPILPWCREQRNTPPGPAYNRYKALASYLCIIDEFSESFHAIKQSIAPSYMSLYLYPQPKATSLAEPLAGDPSSHMPTSDQKNEPMGKSA